MVQVKLYNLYLLVQRVFFSGYSEAVLELVNLQVHQHLLSPGCKTQILDEMIHHFLLRNSQKTQDKLKYKVSICNTDGWVKINGCMKNGRIGWWKETNEKNKHGINKYLSNKHAISLHMLKLYHIYPNYWYAQAWAKLQTYSTVFAILTTLIGTSSGCQMDVQILKQEQ